MDVIDYIRKCVDKHIEMTLDNNSELTVYVARANIERYWFVQIGPIIYIPNSQDIPFNGVFVRTSDLVEGWESFNEIGIEIPFVNKIVVRRRGKVGLYFYVNKLVLADLVDLEDAEIYGDCKIGINSHLDVWDKKYEGIYNKPYDYYPRGRVVYRFKENKFIVYADQCIGDKGIAEVLRVFDIENQNFSIDQTDEHYVCKSCNQSYFE
jgi:hypothetical protein